MDANKKKSPSFLLLLCFASKKDFAAFVCRFPSSPPTVIYFEDRKWESERQCHGKFSLGAKYDDSKNVVFFSPLFYVCMWYFSTFGGLEAMITGLCDEYPQLLGKIHFSLVPDFGNRWSCYNFLCYSFRSKKRTVRGSSLRRDLSLCLTNLHICKYYK